jgi:hypothetical protein
MRIVITTNKNILLNYNKKNKKLNKTELEKLVFGHCTVRLNDLAYSAWHGEA